MVHCMVFFFFFFLVRVCSSGLWVCPIHGHFSWFHCAVLNLGLSWIMGASFIRHSQFSHCNAKRALSGLWFNSSRNTDSETEALCKGYMFISMHMFHLHDCQNCGIEWRQNKTKSAQNPCTIREKRCFLHVFVLNQPFDKSFPWTSYCCWLYLIVAARLWAQFDESIYFSCRSIGWPVAHSIYEWKNSWETDKSSG